MTHVIESPIQMQSIKQNLELVTLQKEQDVKYFQGRNNLAFYIVDCFKACAVSDATKTVLNVRFVFVQNSALTVLPKPAGSCMYFACLCS